MTKATATSLRLDAQALTFDLPGLLMRARRLASTLPGAHGRRQAGPGDAFWQYREHRPEDGARMIDWRRSARSDRLYVREREREVAQTVQLWLDPDPGFAWRSGPDLPPKIERAAVLLLAMGLLLWRGGERVGAPGFAASRASQHADAMLLRALLDIRDAEPPPPALRAGLVLASDGLAPLDDWRRRFERLAGRGCFGALLLIADPAEEDFPFAGRTEFRALDGETRTVFGRAQDVRDTYRERLFAHMTGLVEIAGRHGFVTVRHRTDRPAGAALSALMAAIERRRA
jgi:uncharacterized protein (DUF58 family)